VKDTTTAAAKKEKKKRMETEIAFLFNSAV